MRPPGRARRLRISEIFEGGATQPGGMQCRPNGVPSAAAALGAPNAAGLAPRAAKSRDAVPQLWNRNSRQSAHLLSLRNGDDGGEVQAGCTAAFVIGGEPRCDRRGACAARGLCPVHGPCRDRRHASDSQLGHGGDCRRDRGAPRVRAPPSLRADPDASCGHWLPRTHSLVRRCASRHGAHSGDGMIAGAARQG